MERVCEEKGELKIKKDDSTYFAKFEKTNFICSEYDFCISIQNEPGNYSLLDNCKSELLISKQSLGGIFRFAAFRQKPGNLLMCIWTCQSSAIIHVWNLIIRIITTTLRVKNGQQQ